MKTFPFSRSLFVYHCSFFKFLCCTFCKLNCSCFCHFLWWLFAIAQHFVSCLFRFIDLLTIISLIPQFSFWDHLLAIIDQFLPFLIIFPSIFFCFWFILDEFSAIFYHSFTILTISWVLFLLSNVPLNAFLSLFFKKRRQFQGQITFKTMGIVMKQKSLA